MNAPLKNPRHELLAQALAHGMSAEAAYAEAGYKADRGNAARMTANDSICDRVAELQTAAAETAVITLESHLKARID